MISHSTSPVKGALRDMDRHVHLNTLEAFSEITDRRKSNASVCAAVVNLRRCDQPTNADP